MRPIQKMGVPHLHPFKCVSCGADHTSVRKYFIDTGIDTEWEGVVYYCDSCFRNLSETVGFIDQDRLDELLGIQGESVLKLLELTKKLEVWNRIWMGLTDLSLDDFFKNLEKTNELSRRNSDKTSRTPRTTEQHHLATNLI